MTKLCDLGLEAGETRNKSVLLSDAALLDARAQLGRVANTTGTKHAMRGFMD